MPVFVPKNLLSASTDSLSKRLPTAIITENNVIQNTVQIIKQLKKEIENINAAIKSEGDSSAAAVEGVNQRINSVAGNLERAMEQLRLEMPDSSDIVSKAEFQAFLQNIADYVQIEPEDVHELSDFYPFVSIEPNRESLGFDIRFNGIGFIKENLGRWQSEFPLGWVWVPQWNFHDYINAKGGLSVSQGLAADTVNAQACNIDALAASSGAIDSLASATATISGTLSLGTIENVEEYLNGLSTVTTGVNQNVALGTTSGTANSITGASLPVSGILPVANGGTNASNASAALSNLGIILGSDGNAISIVAGSTNWNDCRKTGFYTVQVDSQNANLNSPITSGGHWGTLLVMCHRNKIGNNAYPITQIYFRDNGDVWVRSIWNSSSWVSPAGTLNDAPAAGANGLWRRWQAGNGASAQLVRGDGSLMYRARGYPMVTGGGFTVQGKCAQIRWRRTAAGQTLTMDSREYLEGDVMDVLCYHNNLGSGSAIFYAISDSGASSTVMNYYMSGSSMMFRFLKGAANLEYLCSWNVNAS